MSEKRNTERKSFSYYMQITDATTEELVGHLSDISDTGFKLDCDAPVPLGKEYRLHMALTADVAIKPFMIFQAQSKWCRQDPIDPFVYNVGFQLINMHPEDREIFSRVSKLYGSKN